MSAAPVVAEAYCAWEQREDRVIDPLCGLSGDAERGQQVAETTATGNCVACHQLPDSDAAFPGTIGPPLAGIGARLDAGQLRLRVIDMHRLNPMTIMPGFYRNPDAFIRPGDAYAGRTFLSAQQVEDLVTWLGGLR